MYFDKLFVVVNNPQDQKLQIKQNKMHCYILEIKKPSPQT